MSASPNPQWLEPTPHLPAVPPVQGKARWPYYAAAAVLAVLGAGLIFRPKAAPVPSPASTVPTIRASRGKLQETLRVAGSISAGHFSNLSAPLLQAPDTGRGLTLVFLVPSGSQVKKGQVLAEFDSQDIKDHLDDVEANIVQAQLDITRRKAQLAAQMENLRQGLRVSRATWDRAAQDARKVPVANPITQENLKLAVEEYQKAYEEAVKQLPLMEARQLADLKLYELNYEHELRHRERHQKDLARCTVHAPMAGMVVMQNVYRGGEMNQIQAGDRLFPGAAVPERGGPRQHAVGRDDEPGGDGAGPAGAARHGALRRLPGYRAAGACAGGRRAGGGWAAAQLLCPAGAGAVDPGDA